MPEVADTDFKRPSLREHPKLRWRSIVNSWPFFVWLALVALALYLYSVSVQYGLLTGNVEVISEPIAPLQTARIKAVNVVQGDRVTNGQIVAIMDTTLVDVQLAEAEATLTEAQNTLAAYEATMHNLVRTFDTAIQTADSSLQDTKMHQESDSAQLVELKKIQAEREELFKEKLIPETVRDELLPQIASLEKNVAAYPAMIVTWNRALDDAKKERDNLNLSLRVKPGGDIMQAIRDKATAQLEVLKAAVDMHRIERDAYYLHPSRDGIVSGVPLVPGDIVQAGSPLFNVVTEKPTRVVGFLPELRLTSLKVGDEAYAFRMMGWSRPVKLKVESLSPDVGLMPGRASPAPGVPLRGSRVLLKVMEPNDFIPGESVQIRVSTLWYAKIRAWLGM